MNRHLLPAICTAVALLFSIISTGCDNSSSPGSTKPGADGKGTPVSIVLNWVPEPEFGGWYDAQVNGTYAKNGLEVTVQKGGPSAPTVDAVASKTFEFGISSAEEIIIKRDKGADLVALFAVYQKSPTAIMTSKKRGVKTLEEALKSGTLFAEDGSDFVTFLEKKYKIPNLKTVPYNGGLPYLTGDDYSQQCFFTAEPLTARAKGEDPQVFLVADEGYNPYTSVLVTSGEYLKSHPEVVKAFVKATKEGWDSYLKDPTAGNDIMAKLNSQMDAKTFKDCADLQQQLIVTDETKAKGLGLMTDERWTEIAKQMVDLGKIKAMPKISDLYVDLR